MNEVRTFTTSSGTEYTERLGVHLGDCEIVLAENMVSKEGFYIVMDSIRTDIFERYANIAGYNDYLAAMLDFNTRLRRQISQVQMQRGKEVATDFALFTAQNCDPPKGNFEGKVLAVKPEVLRPEYRTLTYQIVYCTGGNGAKENARGTKVYTQSLGTEHHDYFRRSDILGVVKPEHLPEWAKDGLKRVEHEQSSKNLPER